MSLKYFGSHRYKNYGICKMFSQGKYICNMFRVHWSVKKEISIILEPEEYGWISRTWMRYLRIIKNFERFEVLMMVTVTSTVLWDVMPYTPIEVYWFSEGMTVNLHQFIWHHIPESSTLTDSVLKWPVCFHWLWKGSIGGVHGDDSIWVP